MSRARSPSYPNTPLGEAINLVGRIFKEDRRNPIDRAVAAKHLGYNGLSGASDMTLAALMHYGLTERVAKGEIRVSQLAVDILHPADPQQRKAALQKAAFLPPLFQALRGRFPDGRFSNEALRSYLTREGFVDRAIAPAARAFSETCAFLEKENAFESGGITAGPEPESFSPPVPTKTYGGASVGDLIQWESGGALQFQQPRRIRLVTDDGQWVCVDGSETGIPMNEVLVEGHSAPPVVVAAAPRFPLDPPAITAGALVSGETEWIKNKVGKETSVRLMVTGEMGVKEISRLIKLLEAQKAVLDEDDAEI